MRIDRRQATAGLLATGVVAAGRSASAAIAASSVARVPLTYSAAAMVLEAATVRLALESLYGGRAAVRNGGVVDLVGGAADIASNGETQVLRHSLRRPGMRILMNVAEGHYPLFARGSAGIRTLADLRGKRILGYRYTTAGYFLHRMLAKAGLTLGDVTLVEPPLGEIRSVVAAGAVDAVAVWEPDSALALRTWRDAGEDVLIFSGRHVYYERYLLCTTASVLGDPARRQAIVVLLRAILAATADLKRNPGLVARAQQMVARSGVLYTPAEVAAGWPDVTFVAALDPDLPVLLAEEERWLAAEEKRPPRSRAELARLIDGSVYRDAVRPDG